MELTPSNKEIIDNKSYENLLWGVRFFPPGDPWFQGETGEYWGKRMKRLKKEGADHVAASKRIGWN